MQTFIDEIVKHELILWKCINMVLKLSMSLTVLEKTPNARESSEGKEWSKTRICAEID